MPNCQSLGRENEGDQNNDGRRVKGRPGVDGAEGGRRERPEQVTTTRIFQADPVLFESCAVSINLKHLPSLGVDAKKKDQHVRTQATWRERNCEMKKVIVLLDHRYALLL